MPVLALDIGGTKLAVGLLTADAEVLAIATCPTDPTHTPRTIIGTLITMAREAAREARLRWEEVRAVGISYGGPVDFPHGRTVTCHHLTGWENFPLRDEVVAQTERPVVMDNDANAAALGETKFGAARGCRHVLYLTVSTGIGAGLVLNGVLHRGATSMAGELGHNRVAPEGPECTCGRHGCLEAMAAGPAIARMAREALVSGEKSVLQSLSPEAITAKDVAEAAVADPLAKRVMAEAGRYLGIAIAGAVNLVNPEMVVIGGGVAQAGAVLFDPIRETVAAYSVPESIRELKIVPAALGSHSALFGAAALALYESL